MRHRFVVIVLAAVLISGGVGYLTGLGVQPLPDGALPNDMTSAVVDANSSDFVGTAATDTEPALPRVDAPLPEANAPLLHIHQALVQRAAAGDARAACRLAAEHERCETARADVRAFALEAAAHSAFIARRTSQFPNASQRAAEMNAHLERLIEEQHALAAACDAAPPLSPAARARYWRQAALAGHLPSMRHYAVGNGFRYHDLMDALPALETYRREAEAMALRAANAGDLVSAYELAMAYANVDGSRRRTFLAQTITPDLPRALGWFSVLARHPTVAGLPARHPIAANVARRHAELQSAATADEVAEADRLTAMVQVREDAQADLALFAHGGAIRDIGPEACSSSEFAAAR